MAFKDLIDVEASTTIRLGGTDKRTREENPTSIEGYYLGTKKVASKKSTSGFSSLHVFQTAEGNVGVWGNTYLDRRLPNLKPGICTRVVFTGMKETANNPMYTYKISTDADNVIEVDAPSAPSNEAAGSAYDDSEEDALDADDESYDSAPAARAVAPRQPAKAPDAARQAQVKALLNGSRK